MGAGGASSTPPAFSGKRTCDLGRVGVNKEGLALALDRRLVDHHLADVFHGRQFVHDVEQHLLDDRAQAAGTGLARKRFLRDRGQRRRPHFEFGAFHAEQLLVLLHQRVLRLGQNLHQRRLVQFFQSGDHGHAPDELWNQAELDQILRLHPAQHRCDVLAVLEAAHLRAETDAALFRAIADDLLQPVEGSAADEQDVGRVHLYEILVRMLPAALRRHRCNGAFYQLQQRLLHAFAGNVARDRRVVRFPRNLVDLVDIDDAALGLVHVVVAVLQQLLDDVLDVLADVTRFGQGGRVGDDEGNVKQPRQRLRQQRLARARGSDQQNVRLRQFDFVVLGQVLEALVVVIDRHRQDSLRHLLADDVLVQDVADLLRRRQVGLARLAALVGAGFFADDIVAQLDAFVADEHRGPGDKLPHLMLALAAEGAVQELFTGILFGHLNLIFGRRRDCSAHCPPNRISPPPRPT